MGVLSNNEALSIRRTSKLLLRSHLQWVVEIFFKWKKGHIRIKSILGNTDNAVRIQIYVAIIAYCIVAIIKRSLEINRSTYEVIRIIGSSLLAKDNIKELFQQVMVEQPHLDEQLQQDF